MRPYDSDYDEFDEFDEFDFSGLRAIRRMANERRRHKPRVRGHRRGGQFGNDHWNADEWSDYDDFDVSDYADYNADEFDAYTGLSTDQY